MRCLREEVDEVGGAWTVAHQVSELIQVAAVCVAWMEQMCMMDEDLAHILDNFVADEFVCVKCGHEADIDVDADGDGPYCDECFKRLES